MLPMHSQYNRIAHDVVQTLPPWVIVSRDRMLSVANEPAPLLDGTFDLLRPHVLEGIAILYCVQGAGRVKINLSEYSGGAGDVCVIAPNSIVQVLEETEKIHVRTVFFSPQSVSDMGLGRVLHQLAQTTNLHATRHLDSAQWRELIFLCDMLTDHLSEGSEAGERLARTYLSAMLQRLAQIYTLPILDAEPHAHSHQEELYRRFLTLLYEHYRRERSVSFYASALHLTPKYFARVIRQVSGHAPLDLINEMVISAACTLLKGTSLTVTQIADELNFPNKSFFGTYFRRLVGQSPAAYREGSRVDRDTGGDE